MAAGLLDRVRSLATPWAVVPVAVCALAALTVSYDAPVVAAAGIGLVGLVFLLARPLAATLLALFLVYANVPVLAARLYGVPTFLAASAVLLLGMPLAHHLLIRRQRLRADRTFALMLGLLLVMATSATFAQAPEIAAARMQVYLLEGVVLYWLVVNVVRDLPTFRRVVWALLAAGALLGGLGAVQAVTDTYGRRFGGLAHREQEIVVATAHDAEEATEVKVSRRASGPVDEPNRFAQILIVLLPLAIFTFRTTPSRAAKTAALVAGLLVLAGVVLTYSRGAFLVLIALAAAAVWVRWLRGVHVLGCALVVLLVLPQIAPTYHERVASIADARGLLGNRPEVRADGAMRGRTTEMLAALHVFLDHPLLGVGPGQYAPVYSVEYQTRPGVAFRDLRIPRRAHSLYLEMAAELGAAGLAVFFAIVGLLLRDLVALRRRARSPEMAELATALAFGLVAYLGTAAFLHLSFERYFWLLLALISAGVYLIRAEAAPAAEVSGDGGDPRRARAWLPGGGGGGGFPVGPAWTALGGGSLASGVRRGLSAGAPGRLLGGARGSVAGSDRGEPTDGVADGAAAPTSQPWHHTPAARIRATLRPLGARLLARTPWAAERSATTLLGAWDGAHRVLAASRGGAQTTWAVARVAVWALAWIAGERSHPLRSAVRSRALRARGAARRTARLRWRGLVARVETLRSRFLYRALDAVVTAPVAHGGGRSLMRVLFPLRQSNFRRVQSAVQAIDARWPLAVERLRARLLRSEALALAGYGPPVPLDFGAGSTVYGLVPRAAGAPIGRATVTDGWGAATEAAGSGAVTGAAGSGPAPDAVLKVLRRSLGQPTDRVLGYALEAQAIYRRMATLYEGTDLVLPTRYLVIQAPLLGRPAAACIQPQLRGEMRDLFDHKDGELLRLLVEHDALARQFREFVYRTVESTRRTRRCLDLVGPSNVLLIRTPQGPRMRIIDFGVMDLDVVLRTRPQVARELHRRIARLVRMRLALDRATLRWPLRPSSMSAIAFNRPRRTGRVRPGDAPCPPSL